MPGGSSAADRPVVGWGVVGTGRVAAQVARAVAASDRCRAVTVAGRDPDRGRAFAEAHGVARAVTSLEQLLDDEDVEIVHVASPNALHAEQVVAAARAGKHVLCEKPMADDVEACRVMAQACRDSGVELAVGFQYRQHPAHAVVRDLVRSGVLGRVVVADAAICLPPMDVPAWYDDQALAGGGVVPMSGVHRLDLLAFLLGGPAREVTAFTCGGRAVPGFEVAAAAVLAHDDDVLATVRFAMDVPHGGDTLSVHGTRGSVRAAGTTTQWWGGGGGEVVVTTDGATQTTRYDAVDLYGRQVEAVVDLLTGGSRDVLAGATDGASAVATASALRESARTGRHVLVPATGLDSREDAR